MSGWVGAQPAPPGTHHSTRTACTNGLVLKRLFSTLLMCAIVVAVAAACESAQSPAEARPAVHESLAARQRFALDAFDGDRAKDIVAFMDQHFRLPGNTGYDDALASMEDIEVGGSSPASAARLSEAQAAVARATLAALAGLGP